MQVHDGTVVIVSQVGQRPRFSQDVMQLLQYVSPQHGRHTGFTNKSKHIEQMSEGAGGSAGYNSKSIRRGVEAIGYGMARSVPLLSRCHGRVPQENRFYAPPLVVAPHRL